MAEIDTNVQAVKKQINADEIAQINGNRKQELIRGDRLGGDLTSHTPAHN